MLRRTLLSMRFAAPQNASLPSITTVRCGPSSDVFQLFALEMDMRRLRRALCLYMHHIDAAREWAYDRQSHIGQLDKALDEAKTKG